MEAEVRDARSREESLQTDLASALGQLEDVTSLKNQVRTSVNGVFITLHKLINAYS